VAFSFKMAVWNILRIVFALLAIVAVALPGQVRPVDAAPAALADQMLADVNRVRAEAGLGPLAKAELLDALAFDRSADMATRHYFSHTTPDGVDVFALLEQRGIGYRTAGENLAWNTYGEDQASGFAMQGFLNSPPHRANLLNPAFSQVGVGVARDGSKTYFTLVFVG
jgi:uncharacterized protein YkwD